MKTLILFVPETQSKKSGFHEDIIINDRRLRIIYYSENLNKVSLLLFKIKIKKLLHGEHIFLNDFSSAFKGKKIYKTGYDLTLHHIVSVVNMAAEERQIVISTSSPEHIDLLSPLLMAYKNIKFLTSEAAYNMFCEKLLNDFGIIGSVSTEEDFTDKAVIIMPGGENISPENSGIIINLSKNTIPWKCIYPKDISFKAPSPLKSVSSVIRHADVMETVLTFLEIDFLYSKPISVKLNKAKV